jgi:hypothetical protein
MGTMRTTFRLKAPLYKEWEEQYRGAAYTLSMAISARQVNPEFLFSKRKKPGPLKTSISQPLWGVNPGFCV